MVDSETRRFIRNEIKQQLNTLLNCVLQTSEDNETQSVEHLYPGAGLLEKIPVMHPWGLASRAPAGMLAVAARLGEHLGARIILGARDPARAEFEMQEGDLLLYDANGNKIHFKASGLHFGSSEADNPAVLGNEALELFSAILDVLINGTAGLTTSPGNPTAPNPAIVPTLQELKTRLITTESTNLLAKKIFFEKGE